MLKENDSRFFKLKMENLMNDTTSRGVRLKKFLLYVKNAALSFYCEAIQKMQKRHQKTFRFCWQIYSCCQRNSLRRSFSFDPSSVRNQNKGSYGSACGLSRVYRHQKLTHCHRRLAGRTWRHVFYDSNAMGHISFLASYSLIISPFRKTLVSLFKNGCKNTK